MSEGDNDLEAGDIDEHFVPRFRDKVAAVELDGEAVLLDGDTGAVHTLNPTATLVWKFCDGTTSLAELIDDLAAVFDGADAQAINADVLALLRELGRQGLLDGVRAEADENPMPRPGGGAPQEEIGSHD